MQILITLVIGLIVGMVAKLLVPGRDPGGMLVTSLLGIGGALLARYIGVWSHWYGPTDSVGFLSAVVGAIIILLVYRMFIHRSPRMA